MMSMLQNADFDAILIMPRQLKSIDWFDPYRITFMEENEALNIIKPIMKPHRNPAQSM